METGMRMKMEAAAPFAGMVMVECAQVGLMIASKQAMSTGMSNLVFVLYSNALAALVLLPFSFFFHRSLFSHHFFSNNIVPLKIAP